MTLNAEVKSQRESDSPKQQLLVGISSIVKVFGSADTFFFIFEIKNKHFDNSLSK